MIATQRDLHQIEPDTVAAAIDTCSPSLVCTLIQICTKHEVVINQGFTHQVVYQQEFF